ncbi:MAG: Nucleoside transporter, permease protein 1 [Hyphomicrobiales bacterium]|nr:Nucleoside transporter, permease protein 1 [Hyphomicrobiales bacterium]
MTDSTSSAVGTVRRLLLPTNLLSAVIAVLLAFVVGAVLIALVGVNPLTAYGTLFQASLGSANGLSETALRTVPLALCGMGIALAFRSGVFNVGAEGQLFIGGIAAAVTGTALGSLPQAMLLPAMAMAAALAGAGWSAIAGWLKLKFRSDELITTIMLNYVAIYFVSYLLHGPLQEPGSALAQTARLASNARLPVILPMTRLHAGIIVVVVLAIAAQVFLWRTVWGFRLRAVGHNSRAAANAGIGVGGVVLSGFLGCGALAGLAGFMEVAGVQRRMIENLSPGFGYTAIIVALLGQTNPAGVLLAAVLFAALQIGSTTMESAVGVPSALTTIIQALVVLFLVAQNLMPMLRVGLRNRVAGRS